MAGDWIPIRVDLKDDPAVIAIAVATGLDEFAVVGRLFHLWSWANRHLSSGHAPSVTEPWIDRCVSAAGFAAAMLKAGWLLPRSGGVEFPNFDRWNSQGAKRRLLASQRKAKERSRLKCDKNATREEKRRDEEANASSAPGEPAKKRRKKRDRKPREPDPLFDAVAEITGSDPKVSGSFVGAVRAQLAKGEPPYTPEEVREFGRRFPELCEWASREQRARPTLGEVEKYIGRLRNGPGKFKAPGMDEKQRAEQVRLQRVRAAQDAADAMTPEELAKARALRDAALSGIGKPVT